MLAIEQVGKTYPSGVHALDGVSLNVELGEIVAVVGGSGCGKSTLLRAVSGLDTPTQGRVSLDGVQITDAAREDRHRLPGAAAAAVADGCRQRRLRSRRPADARSATRRVAAQLERVGLAEKAGRLAARTCPAGRRSASRSRARW